MRDWLLSQLKKEKIDGKVPAKEKLKGLEDVRPGLLTKAQKRKKKCEEKHELSKPLPKRKMIKVAEREARQQALSTPISTASKGYSLLQKMGYKEGTGLGKSGRD